MWLKVLVVVYGILSIALAFCAHFVGPLLQASMTILGIIGGPMLAVFTLGILVPYVNQKVTIKRDSLYTCIAHDTKLNTKNVGKWVPLYCTVDVEWVTVMNV
jgi:hypothetical protein